MKKSDFEEIQQRYLKGRKRLEGIAKGDLVWEEIGRCGDNDYHPAVVKSVNVDEDYIDVIDVSDSNKEKRYISFVTESELIKQGFTAETIKKDYKEYAEIIKKVTQN
jgi:hypothetical protein